VNMITLPSPHCRYILMFKFAYFLFFALGVVCVTALGTPATPIERELSNAARLARGLPPRSPIFGRFLPGRRTSTISEDLALFTIIRSFHMLRTL